MTVRRPILVPFGDSYSVPPVTNDPLVVLPPTVPVQNPPVVAGPSGIDRAPSLVSAYRILNSLSSDVTSNTSNVVRYRLAHLERDLHFLNLNTDEEYARGVFVFYSCLSVSSFL